MDFFEVVKKRRSVRKFTNAEMPEAVMKKCLKASVQAPNSSNLQPWEFYWIRSKEKKEQVVKACFSQNAAKTAKELVVAVARIDTWKRNRDLIIEEYKKQNKLIPLVNNYYNSGNISSNKKYYANQENINRFCGTKQVNTFLDCMLLL